MPRSLETPPSRPRAKGARAAANGDAHGRKRDAEVLEAAVKVFYEKGYSDATVQDIADELGILKGSLYHYIRTKEDLLFRLFETVHEQVDALAQQVTKAEGLTPRERLELYVRLHVTYNIDNLAWITVYYHDMEKLGPERLAAVRERRRDADQLVTRLIRAAQRAGEADRSLDARLLSHCIFATIIWTYRWYRPRSGASRSTTIDTCVRYAMNGIGGTSS
ncbi:MAG TPA: TetR/AcrR family transcriptional regulator [Conexibacter sp.]|jgi:AcrR family transcriptional regulator